MNALVLCCSNSGKSRLKDIEVILGAIGGKYTTDVYVSEYPGSMADYLTSSPKEYALVVLLGGDGTVHEIINAVMKMEYKPVLAVIPRGTCNDFAKNLGMPKDIYQCMKVILKGEEKKLSLFSAGGEYFSYGLAMGYLNELSYKAPKGVKRIFGIFGYYLEAIPVFFRTKPAVINGEEYSFYFLLKTSHLAGRSLKHLSSDISSEELIRLRMKKRNKLAACFSFFLFLMSHGKRRKGFLVDTLREEELKTEENINLDGERVKSASPVRVCGIDKHLSFIVNEDVK